MCVQSENKDFNVIKGQEPGLHRRLQSNTSEQNTNGKTFSVVDMETTDVTAAGSIMGCLASGALPNLLPVCSLFAQNYLLGIIISICGNVLISVSLNIQVRSASRQQERSASEGLSCPTSFPLIVYSVFTRIFVNLP